MKKLLLLLLCALLCLPLMGCVSNTRACSDTIEEFLAAIQSGAYAEAYSLLASSSRNDTVQAKSTSIMASEFVSRYTNILSALEIHEIEYSNLVVNAGEIIATATYTAIYHSDYIGDLTENFKLTAVRESGKWYIQWSPSLIFPEMQWGDTVRVATISAKRGEILADGEVLAVTEGKITVYAAPSKITDEPLFVAQVAALLDMSEEAVYKALNKAYDDFATLKTFYPDELRSTIETQLLSIEGIGIDYGNYGAQRDYPYGSLLAHTIGYVGSISEEQLAALNDGRDPADGLYTEDSNVGKLGLERQYEEILRGKDGEIAYIRTSTGTNRRTLYEREAQDGYDINLTINLALQERVEELLSLVLYGETTAGAVVVMNPLTGEVEAIASYPSYDLNLFSRGISAENYEALLNQENKPLINRSTQGLYPPGSTMKIFTAAAALDNNVLDRNYVFTGNIEADYWLPTEYGEWIWSKIKRATVKYRRTPLNMENAIIHSDNIYFANAALMMGEEIFMDYMASLGFTESIPFDINVATAQLHNKDTEITRKILADSGYGQGEILVTPLQLAAMSCAFANGGNVLVPRIIEGFYAVDGIKYTCVQADGPMIWKEGVISEEAIVIIKSMMEKVVLSSYNGTGQKLGVTSCTVAAKTGTAEIGDDKSREISWFVGFRTGVADEDARLVLVMLEVPAKTEYTTLKFDIARELLKMSAP